MNLTYAERRGRTFFILEDWGVLEPPVILIEFHVVMLYKDDDSEEKYASVSHKFHGSKHRIDSSLLKRLSGIHREYDLTNVPNDFDTKEEADAFVDNVYTDYYHVVKEKQ